MLAIIKMRVLKFTGRWFGGRHVFLAGLLVIGLSNPQAGHAALTFNFNYLDAGSGFGFWDPVYGAERRASLQAAANDLGSYFTGYTASLEFDVMSLDEPGTGILAGGGSSVYLNRGSFQQTFVQSEILTGADVNGSAADGFIEWNFSSDTAWDTGDSVADGSYDLKATAVHELLHAFGFTSAVDDAGGGLEYLPPGTPDTWFTFDQFLTNGAGEPLIDPDGVFDAAKVDDVTGGTGTEGLFFGGANAVAANGGNLVNLYSPNPFEPGSSVAHLDDEYFTGRDLVMESSVYSGTGTRTLSAVELGILRDIGYAKVAPVPVPAAVWLMMSGLAMLIAMSRRRRAPAVGRTC